jgi:hypothetical protein
MSENFFFPQVDSEPSHLPKMCAGKAHFEMTLEELFSSVPDIDGLFNVEDVDTVTKSIQETAHLNQRQPIVGELPKGFFIKEESICEAKTEVGSPELRPVSTAFMRLKQIQVPGQENMSDTQSDFSGSKPVERFVIYKNRKDVVIKTLLRSFRRFFIYTLYQRAQLPNPDEANSNAVLKIE